MGIGFAILFYLIVAGGFLLVSWPLCLLIRAVFRVEDGWFRRALTWTPPLLAVLPPMAGGLVMLWMNNTPAPLLFKRVFDRLPGEGITELRADGSAGNDYGEVFLLFRASPDALQKLVNASGTKPIFGRLARELAPMPGSEAPEWWLLVQCGNRHVYFKASKDSKLAITECPHSDTVHVEWRWIN